MEIALRAKSDWVAADTGGREASALAVSHAELRTPIGPVGVFGTARGLVALALPGIGRAVVEARLRRLLGPVMIVRDDAPLAEALGQLRAYFAGTRRSFDLPLDPRGTAFQRAVWATVAAIPYGETRTYLAIARTIGRPTAARAVGAANGANPLPLVIPCHRVVSASGRLTGYAGGLSVKQQLLDCERAATLA